MIVIGIDPGVVTGVAVWNAAEKRLELVTSCAIHRAFKVVEDYQPALVIVEDARKRTWFGQTGREKLQGAGSVKRDSGIWEAYLKDQGIPAHLVSPKAKGRKVDAATFQRITKYLQSTNQHGRDAAMLVFGLNAASVNRILSEVKR